MRIGSLVIGPNSELVTSPQVSYTLFRGAGWRDRSYRHEIRADGGFWGASFEAIGDREFLRHLFEHGLMLRFRSFVEDGDLAFEGYIQEMTLRTGFEEHTISLDNLANWAAATYNTSATQGAGSQIKDYNAEDYSQVLAGTSATASFSLGTVGQDTDSQDRFGKHERLINAGDVPATAANLIGPLVVARQAWPYVPSRRIEIGRGVNRWSLHVKVYGFIRYWARRYHYNNDSGATDNIKNVIDDLVTDYGTFIKSSYVQTNAIIVNTHLVTRRAVLDYLRGLVAMGDSNNNRWVFGFDKDYYFYAKEATLPDAANLLYTGTMTDRGPQILQFGSIPVPLPLVRPAEFYKSGYARPWQAATPQDIALNPNIHFIESVIYQEPNGLQLLAEKDETLDLLLARSGQGGFSKI